MATDTLALARRLRQHFQPEQAELLAEEIGHLLPDAPATKGDVAELRTAVRADIVDVRGEIAALRVEMAGHQAALYRHLSTQTWIIIGGVLGGLTTLVGAVLGVARLVHLI